MNQRDGNAKSKLGSFHAETLEAPVRDGGAGGALLLEGGAGGGTEPEETELEADLLLGGVRTLKTSSFLVDLGGTGATGFFFSGTAGFILCGGFSTSSLARPG